MSSVVHAASESYTASGFANRLKWGSCPALLVVDLCDAYFTPSSPLSLLSNPSALLVPSTIRSLLAAAREGGVPVLWTTIEYTSPSMLDAGLFYEKTRACSIWQTGDTRNLAGWLDGLAPEADDVVVVKKYPSGFFGTTLASELVTRGVDTVVVCGVSTSGLFVPSLAPPGEGLMASLYEQVVGSACGDRTAEIQNANLFDLDAKYADVVEEAEAVEKLRQGWARKR
ncbi:hypothetical protein JCM1840_004900 [Sporobolomyces johnsonii]